MRICIAIICLSMLLNSSAKSASLSKKAIDIDHRPITKRGSEKPVLENKPDLPGYPETAPLLSKVYKAEGLRWE